MLAYSSWDSDSPVSTSPPICRANKSQSSLPEHYRHVMAGYVQSRMSGRNSFGRADLRGARRLCSFALHTLRYPLHALHQSLACLGAGGLHAASSM